MIELKKSEAREKIFQAYEEKRLSAQNRSDICRYRDTNGHPCAIGVLLDDDTAKEFDRLEQSSMKALINSELITTDDNDWFEIVQRYHDSWLGANIRVKYNEEYSYKEYETRFLEILNS